MSATFGSVREAVAHYYRRRGRGPRAARPRWDDGPRAQRSPSSDLGDTAWILVGTAIHSAEHCGVEVGSQLDVDLRDWALEVGTYTPQVRRLEDQLRKLLRVEGLLAPQRRYRSTRCASTGTTRVRTIPGE